MLTITKASPNRVDIDVGGKLDARTMQMGLDDLLAKAHDVENGRMLYTLPELALPTMGALAVELQRLPSLFGLLGKFDRCAVLSDAPWIRTAAEIEGAVFPGITIKGFTLDDRDAAEAWLSQGTV